MNTKDKIGKVAWSIGDACKDVAKANIVQLVRAGKLKIDEQTQQLLLSIVDSSIDQAMHSAHKNFMKTIDKWVVEPTVPTK